MTKPKKPRTARGQKIHFSTKSVLAANPSLNRIVSAHIAPDADDQAKKGPAGIVYSLLQLFCTYDGFKIAGHVVVGSVATGFQTTYRDGKHTAMGYEWGTLANGDHYLSRVEEEGGLKGTQGSWKLVQGTGTLVGITGEATYSINPLPGATSVISALTGWYSLPKKKDSRPTRERKAKS